MYVPEPKQKLSAVSDSSVGIPFALKKTQDDFEAKVFHFAVNMFSHSMWEQYNRMIPVIAPGQTTAHLNRPQLNIPAIFIEL